MTRIFVTKQPVSIDLKKLLKEVILNKELTDYLESNTKKAADDKVKTQLNTAI